MHNFKLNNVSSIYDRNRKNKTCESIPALKFAEGSSKANPRA